MLLALAGCASASPEYIGLEPRRMVIEGTEIRVWQRGDRAQAIRMGWIARGEHGVAMARMVQAIEAVTGCDVRQDFIAGDSGVLNARLEC